MADPPELHRHRCGHVGFRQDEGQVHAPDRRVRLDVRGDAGLRRSAAALPEDGAGDERDDARGTTREVPAVPAGSDGAGQEAARRGGDPLKKRLLAVLPDHPHPATMGGRVRNLSILEALSPHFDLEIVTLVHDRVRLNDPGPVASLGRWSPVLAWNRRSPLHRVAGQVAYRTIGRGWERETWFLGSAALARAVEEILRERPPDLVHVAYWYTLRRLRRRPRPPVWVLDTHDVQFERWERLHGRVSPKDRAGEIEELQRHDVVVGITPHDAETFRRILGPRARVETIGMGVDLKRWSREAFSPQKRGASIVYYGNMAAEMNVQAARHLCNDILPHLRSLRDEVAVVILGADPRPEVRSLAAMPEVRVTGTVEDPRPVLVPCGVFALCLRAASGIRSRACEAMALGVPVVAYPESLEGMGFEDGRHYLAAENAEDFARKIDRVLVDRELAGRLAAEARERVREHYGIAATYGRFVSLYRELLEDPTGIRDDTGSGRGTGKRTSPE
ncbi:MAG: glycosyltransferase [Candidatus Eisenbacteria bacterium]|nr:glycosyltransferase [Candidatus Latescibacterota bacterium]MBD3303193.1 glycosyltransferase [Candidatus Eisenbacteria bacterium]